MKPADLVRSKWLTYEDLGRDNLPKEPTLTIAKFTLQKMGKGDTWGVVHWKEDVKPYRANVTFRKALERMFGDRDTDDWIGKRVTLYARPGTYGIGATAKKFAVRIKGSPDIKQTLSFKVAGFGSDDVYNLVPTGANVKLGPGVVRFGQQSGHYGKAFDELDDEQLQTLMQDATKFIEDPKNSADPKLAKYLPDLKANVHEIFECLKERAAARVPPPDPEVPAEVPPL